MGSRCVAGVPMHTIWHYKSSTVGCDGLSGSDGTASCLRTIGRATIGYYVRIDVQFTYAGQVYLESTGFTPH